MFNTPFNIKMRLGKLGKYQVDLIPELAKRGLKVDSTELSYTIRGISQSPKSGKILFAANKIVSEWELVAGRE